MKIAVLSDTHTTEKSLPSLKQFLNELDNPDLIIHCGDIASYAAYELIKLHNKCVAVHGNVDDERCKFELKEKEIIKLKGYTIGIFHGHGEKGTTLKRVKDKFKDEEIDIAIYGHSHVPTIFTEDKVLFLNPGSLFYKRKERWYSYILLELEEKNIVASLHFYRSC